MKQDEYLDHSLPSSDEAEQVCIGAVLLDNSVLETCKQHFVPTDLYSPYLRMIYAAMLTLDKEGSPIDPIFIGEVLKRDLIKRGALENSGGIARITNLTFGLPHFTNIEEYAKIIKAHSVSRQALRLCNTISRDILSGDVEAVDVVAKLERKAIALSTSLGSTGERDPVGFAKVDSLADTIKAQFERYHRGESTGVKTGMKQLDDMLDGGGLQPKGTYVVGGMEKSGKTSLALDWVEDIAIRQDKAALIVTLEMSKETLLKRLYAKYTGIPYYMFRPGFKDTANNPAYTKAMQEIDEFCKYPFKIADNLFAIDDIYRHCAKEVELGHKPENKEIGVILLDYLQLINPSGSHNSREREVGTVSRAIKMLASDLDVPVVVMSSLNRFGLTEGQVPDAHNLRDSGNIGFDAEAVLFVYNPAFVPGKPYEPREITDMQLILSRQRNGPTGTIPLKFIGPYMQFMTEDDFSKHFASKTGELETKGQAERRVAEVEDIWDLSDDDDEWLKG